MKFARKVWDWLDKWLPYVWGFVLVFAITGGLFGVLIASIKWILALLGVI